MSSAYPLSLRNQGKKHKLYKQQDRLVDFIISPPYFELFCTIVVIPCHTKSYNNALTQRHVDGSQKSLGYLW